MSGRSFVAVLALCACSSGGGGTASLRVHIDRAPGAMTPAYVLLSAYTGRNDASFHDRRIDAALPNDTLITPVTDFSPWRLYAWGYTNGARSSFATVEISPAASGETVATLLLGSNLPTDTDGDGVPDNFDDCPQTADPNQTGNCPGPMDIDAPAMNMPDAPPMNGPNLIMNPGCEMGTTGWSGYHSTLSQSPIPRSGNFSCQVCDNPTFTDYTIDDSPNTVSMPLAGQLYVASAWVRSGPTNVATRTITLTLREHPTQGVIGAQSEGQPVTLSDQWQQITSAHMMTGDAFDLDIYIGGSGQPADCFLVDDIFLARVL